MVLNSVMQQLTSGFIELPPPSIGEKWLGHWHTIAPFLRRARAKQAVPATETVYVELNDSVAGPVRLSAQLFRAEPVTSGEEPLTEPTLIALHGLGGSASSGYMIEALLAAEQQGVNLLLFNARGSDRSGQDINHAGLIDDLKAWFESPLLAQCSAISLLGYSLGGHLALSYAAQQPSSKLHRVAALCSPLSLRESAYAFDEPSFSVYRRHVLSSLYEIYTAAFQRRPAGIVPEKARKIKKIVEWDDAVVAPRFGFSCADEYYAAASVAPLLNQLKVPSLYVGAVHDPMVPHSAVAPGLAHAKEAIASNQLRCLWDHKAGHLGFSSDFRLPEELRDDAALTAGVEAQVMHWLLKND